MSSFTAPANPSTSGRLSPCVHNAWRLLACPGPLRGRAQPHSRFIRPRRAAAARAQAVEEAGAAAPAPAAGEWVEIGVVGAPHGVRGEFKVQPLTDFPEERLGTPGTRWLRAPVPKLGRRRPAEPTEVELEYGRTTIFKGNEVWIVKLEGIDTPEDARLLRGHSLLIPPSARGELEDEDEFYVQDLVGLRVFLQSSGEELGRVVDLFDGTGTHDVLRIRLLEPPASAGTADAGDGSGGGSADARTPPRFVLLPFAKQVVPVVDLAAGRMEINPPEGLLELATAPAAKADRRESRGRRERRRRGQRAGSDPAASASEPEASEAGDK